MFLLFVFEFMSLGQRKHFFPQVNVLFCWIVCFFNIPVVLSLGLADCHSSRCDDDDRGRLAPLSPPPFTHQLFISRLEGAGAKEQPSSGREECGATGWMCVCMWLLHRWGLCVEGHLEKHTHTHTLSQ